MNKNEAVKEFLGRFYDICSSIEASNYTLDEFYSDFPVEMHDFLMELSEKGKNEVKNG